MASLATDLRQDIQEAARRQVAAMERAFPRLRETPVLNNWSDGEVDLIVEKFADLPCPALGPDGSCRVYPFRPVTCRAMGVPLEEGGMVHGACEVQTAVPIVKLPRALREEEDRLSTVEAAAMQTASDEVLLPYGFLSEPSLTQARSRQF
jgi:Fe-S-cluster containining protein